MFFNILLLAVPSAIALHFLHADPTWTFVIAALGIVPLAKLMGEATEHIASKTGPGIGGFLNATFGNATELIIALFALEKGLHEIVRASITGSIIGNILFVLGLSMVAGGTKFREQSFDVRSAGAGIGMLVLAVISVIMPTSFHYFTPYAGTSREHALSLATAIVLLVCYGAYLVFSLKTHKDYFGGGHDAEEESSEESAWSMKKSVGVLVASTVCVALVSEVLVGSIEHAAKAWGLNDLFVGVFLLAIIGNAAEHSTAVMVAMKNRMELAFQIAVGSSVQVALLVAPVLVLASYLFGNPLDLVFAPLEALVLTSSVFVVWSASQDGKTNWMEGVMLLGTYAICGIVFYFSA